MGNYYFVVILLGFFILVATVSYIRYLILKRSNSLLWHRFNMVKTLAEGNLGQVRFALKQLPVEALDEEYLVRMLENRFYESSNSWIAFLSIYRLIEELPEDMRVRIFDIFITSCARQKWDFWEYVYYVSVTNNANYQVDKEVEEIINIFDPVSQEKIYGKVLSRLENFYKSQVIAGVSQDDLGKLYNELERVKDMMVLATHK